VSVVADIGKVIGQRSGLPAVGQGKIHTRVVEGEDGRIYGGTMMGGHYSHRVATYDYPRSYPGGHLWVYDPRTGVTSDLGIPVPREAVYSVAVDTDRGKLYGITFHHRQFFVYDLNSGSVELKGDVGVGEDVYVDTAGFVYTNGPWGNVVRYDPDADELIDLPIYFPRRPDGSQGTNGPNMATLATDGGIYSTTFWGIIYRFDPHAGALGEMVSFGSVLGEGEEHVYTPNLALSRDLTTFYYLAGCHGRYLKEDRSGVHFAEMDAATGKVRDHGLIVTDPQITGCFAAGTGPDGTVYFGAQCWGEISWDGQRRPPGSPILMIYRPDQ
jgi:sugar lactone lactonase YvrE